MADRRAFLRAAGLLAGAACLGRRARAATGPNILFVLADDLGWGDPSCYGNRRFRTPNLDRLAAGGMLFTQYYQCGSVCSPSRAGLMTGRYPAELRLHGHLATAQENTNRGMDQRLDPGVPTLPRLLRSAGYRTLHIGKWHLGLPAGAPTGAGALDAYGFDDARWVDASGEIENEKVSLWAPPNRPRASRVLVDQTIEALDQVGGQPFYCQLWLNDPHAPLAPSPEQMAPYRGSVPTGYTSPQMVFGGTVAEMDRQIGRLLDHLQAKGLADNTLVIFSSDNGPEDIEIGNATWSGVGSAGPLRGRKRSLYEGGVRVPFIVRWPGQVPAGRVNNQAVVSGADLLPTLAELAGASLPDAARPALHGQSVAPALRGDQAWRRTRPLMWEWRFRVFNHPWNRSPVLAIRDGQWKLLLNPDRSRVELYDIPADPGEQTNLADRQPEVVKRLADQVLAWQKTLPEGPVEAVAGQNGYPWPADSAKP